MDKKIVLIDGNSILNRAFYGLPLLTNAEGLHTNAVYGFLNIMFKIVDEEQPEYLAVAFDVKAPTFRHKMFQEYKGTRKPMPEELREQLPIIREVLAAMNVNIIELAGFEADDIIGTLAKKSEALGINVAIISGDRDLLQLATNVVKVRIPKTKATGTVIEDYYAKDVNEYYGVSPIQFIDVKALMGDTSDNIPGVSGIGEKTAVKLIQEYTSLDNILDNIDLVKPLRISNKLKEERDIALLSKKLATIKLDCPVELNLEKAKYNPAFDEKVYTMYKKLEFKSLLSRTTAKQETEPKFQYTINKITSMDELIACTAKAVQSKKIAIKLFFTFKINSLCFAFDEKEIYYAPVNNQLTENEIINACNGLYNSNATIVTLDLKKQLKYLTIVNENNCFDANIAAYLVNPTKETYGYDDIAKDYLNIIFQSEPQPKSNKTPLEQMLDEDNNLDVYCNEIITLFKAYEPMVAKLKLTNMYSLFTDMEMPLVFVLDSMEKYGIKVNRSSLDIYASSLEGRINELENSIYELAEEKFNINSPKQLGDILFEKLMLPKGKKTKTGYSTNQDVLDGLINVHPIISLLIEYRQLTKLKSTYADGLKNYISTDGRIHSTFNQTITATGRISSTDPNLQNIPIRLELGRLIRKVFIPEEDYIFVDADYSQIELRVLAHMSGDTKLLDAYNKGEDIHTITASEIFGLPIEQVTPQMRRNAKAVNFGIIYGISAFGLSQDLSITRKEADKFIAHYFVTYPNIKQFLDECISVAKSTGYSTTIFNRRRPIPEIKESNFVRRSFGERIAMNSPIQGTAADIIKIAMIKVDKRLKKEHLKSRLILQVHDELLIETHKSEIAIIKNILKEEMENAVQLSIPLEIDISTGNDWYEAK